MKSQLLLALFGLTGIGASGQLFVPGALPPPAALHRPPLAFPPRPAPARPAPAPEPQAGPELAPPDSTPLPAAPVPDRIMVVGGAELYNERAESPVREDIEAAPLDVPDAGEGVPAWEETFRGRWHKGRGLRFQLVFHNATGVTWYENGRFHVVQRGRRGPPVPAPAGTSLRESYAVYPDGAEVRFSFVVENTGTETLRDVKLTTRQIALDHSGLPEGALGGVTHSVIERLPPGRRTWRQASFRLSRGPRERPVNFQQTHATIRAEGKTLADEKRAAVIDPPAGW